MLSRKQHALVNELTRWRDFRIKVFIEGILVGFLAGVVIVLFRFSLEKAEAGREAIFSLLSREGPVGIFLWFISLAGIGIIVGFIVKLVPLSRGSGITQIKGTLLGQIKMKWYKVLAAKFFGAIIAIGAGLSLGRQGPSVQLGAVVGQGVSRMLGRFRTEEKYLITSGASAGLAAAFNAPLAGVIFALEELHKNFSPGVLLAAMAASLTADIVTQGFFGVEPVFRFLNLPLFPLKYYGYLLGLGVIAGLVGVSFNRGLIGIQALTQRQKLVPNTILPVIPLLIGGVLAFFVPASLSGGEKLINTLGKADYGIQIVLLILIVKYGFTLLSFGSGAPGGIFLPTLAMGALLGDVYTSALINIFGTDPIFTLNFIVFAMAAFFTAITKAPITGSILITEMTGSFHHLLPLIFVSMTAYLISDLTGSRPIYEALYEQTRFHQGEGTIEPRKEVIEAVVCVGSIIEGKKVREITWPSPCLLVSLRRGESEMIPKGDTRIRAGDYLYILTDDEKTQYVQRIVDKLAGECSDNQQS